MIPHQPDFRLDFITPVGRKNTSLINFPNLNVAMQPLKFIEYSLENIHQAALLSEEGAILVNVPGPAPARFALLKLHTLSLLSAKVKIGDVVEIKYKSGRGNVTKQEK